MALIRASVLKDFRSSALSTTDNGSAYQLGAFTTGRQFYAGLHLTCVTLGTTARVLAMSIQSATASGFAAPSTRAQFALSTVYGAETVSPVSSLSTEHTWWRAVWSLSTAASTGGQWKGLVWMGVPQ